MQKTFSIEKIDKNEYMSWYFTTQISKTVQMKLFDKVKVYDEKTKCGTDIDVPVIMGAGLCMGDQLSITFESDSDINYTLVSQDILAERGNIIGHKFTVTGCLNDGGTGNDVFFSITSSKVEKMPAEVSEKEFIAGLFYKYLILRDKYLLNYISDKK